jgi:murein L,D-transpeptidase YafK
MKRRLTFLALAGLFLGLMFWIDRQPTRFRNVCLPLPDLSSWMTPTPKLELPYPVPPAPEAWDTWPAEQRLTDVNQRVRPLLATLLQQRSFTLGSAVYLRAYKEERELELWLKAGQGWELWRTYPVAAASGRLGPKEREGDHQVPEGFYAITSHQLNPASRYHLAFNIGYPNPLDLHHQRTGSFIMFHGRNVSIGCLAMTDPAIEEIYLLVEAALAAAQPSVPVHCFPFRLTSSRLNTCTDHPWHTFWKEELLPAHAFFEQHREIPEMQVTDGRYTLEALQKARLHPPP